MKVLKTANEMRTARAALAEGAVGLVPTMGSLHAGHAALIRAAREASEQVVCTIFVNRAQFDRADDFENYPRALADDLDMLRELNVDYAFAPSESEIYPAGEQATVTVPDIAHIMEVRARPGHFEGVATVLTKLFALIRPARAYFGVKDYYQLRMAQMLARALLLATEIVPVATVRDERGLALSSRNRRLTAEQMQVAPLLYSALSHVERVWNRGVRNGNIIKQTVADIFADEALMRLDYVSAADALTLREVQVATSDTVVCAAAYLGEVRLLDNVLLKF